MDDSGCVYSLTHSRCPILISSTEISKTGHAPLQGMPFRQLQFPQTICCHAICCVIAHSHVPHHPPTQYSSPRKAGALPLAATCKAPASLHPSAWLEPPKKPKDNPRAGFNTPPQVSGCADGSCTFKSVPPTDMRGGMSVQDCWQPWMARRSRPGWTCTASIGTPTNRTTST